MASPNSLDISPALPKRVSNECWWIYFPPPSSFSPVTSRIRMKHVRNVLRTRLTLMRKWSQGPREWLIWHKSLFQSQSMFGPTNIKNTTYIYLWPRSSQQLPSLNPSLSVSGCHVRAANWAPWSPLNCRSLSVASLSPPCHLFVVPLLRQLYRAGIRSRPQVEKKFQASWGRSGKKQQEQNSPNRGASF